MKGYILSYRVQTNSGVISGDDNQHYTFSGADWAASEPPHSGMRVDFSTRGSVATDIYKAIETVQPLASQGAGVGEGSRSKTTAALLAFFLGGLGVHKFYLGRVGPGLTHLVLWFLSIASLDASMDPEVPPSEVATYIGMFFFLGIPNGIIVLIEFVIYLSKSRDQFERDYVIGKKGWF